MNAIEINHNGQTLYEMLNITKVEEYKIMLDPEHELHDKLILCQFLNSDARGAVSIAMLAIANNAMPNPVQVSSSIEAIVKCDDEVITTLISLFGIGDFFTSEGAKAHIKLTVEEDEELKELRG